VRGPGRHSLATAPQMIDSTRRPGVPNGLPASYRFFGMQPRMTHVPQPALLGEHHFRAMSRCHARGADASRPAPDHEQVDVEFRFAGRR
jgi:hypothetical protein